MTRGVFFCVETSFVYIPKHIHTWIHTHLRSPERSGNGDVDDLATCREDNVGENSSGLPKLPAPVYNLRRGNSG